MPPRKTDEKSEDKAEETVEATASVDDEHIRSVVRSVLDEYLGEDHQQKSDDHDDEPEHEVKSAREVESDTFKIVREAMKSLKEEESHAEDHARMRETPEEKPAPVRALTKALWG